jgi:hypothetical protein
VTTTVLPCSAMETELNSTLDGQAARLTAALAELLSDEPAVPLVAPARAA